MFDYQGWIEEAERFTISINCLKNHFEKVNVKTSVQPPVDEKELQDLVVKIGVYVPKELQRFWVQGARSCRFYYLCDGAKGAMAEREKQVFGDNGSVWSGVSFLDPFRLVDQLDTCKRWAAVFEKFSDLTQAAIWRNTLPFQSIANGDYLGLDISSEQDDPPVVYLAHDDNSQIIAPSFTSFLRNWAELRYFGPESWMISLFQSENGFLDATSPTAILWRQMLNRE